MKLIARIVNLIGNRVEQNSLDCLELLPYFLICIYKVFQQKEEDVASGGNDKHITVFFCRFSFCIPSQRQPCFFSQKIQDNIIMHSELDAYS